MNQINHFTIEAGKMTLSTGKTLSFPCAVQKAVEFAHTTVVMLDVPPEARLRTRG